MSADCKQKALMYRGIGRLSRFCRANKIEAPEVQDQNNWNVHACTYYRPNCGIRLCLNRCARLATERQVRNWNWPGSVTDREPYGVICHELGHHVDLLSGDLKGKYYSEFSEKVMNETKEAPITSYCPNPAEWFAEMFRLFVTNHALLKEMRPNTHKRLLAQFAPVSKDDWQVELGSSVPSRIVDNLKRRIIKGR